MFLLNPCNLKFGAVSPTSGAKSKAKVEFQLKIRKNDINILTTKFLIKFRIFLNQLHLILQIYLIPLFV